MSDADPIAVLRDTRECLYYEWGADDLAAYDAALAQVEALVEAAHEQAEAQRIVDAKRPEFAAGDLDRLLIAQLKLNTALWPFPRKEQA